jgi:hypothetical protein
MWIFSVYGFYSISVPKDNPRIVMVRARMSEHLENLRKRFASVAQTEIVESAGTDYAYRMIVTRKVWEAILTDMSAEQTWNNFKDKVAENKEHINSGYEAALHKVWSEMFKLQPWKWDYEYQDTDKVWAELRQSLRAKKLKKKARKQKKASLV